VSQGWSLSQLYVNNAFIHGVLEEEYICGNLLGMKTRKHLITCVS
jgi:hypothetical protein